LHAAIGQNIWQPLIAPMFCPAMVVDSVTALIANVAAYRDLCQRSPVGKHLPDALYVHQSALSALDPTLQAVEAQARTAVPLAAQATLVKFSLSQPQVAYLFYPDFDTEAHPALHSSIQVNLKTGMVGDRDYSTTSNPPVLHRKETFVTPDYPHYDRFGWLTQQEETLGLLEQSRGIGFQQAWDKRLRDRGLEIHDHALACAI
jgi:DNA phosphorothioation-associated putative methyltransferase